jgi:D-arabinose 1-dehydrogenase-like Zn-dependent alcohol dehydrogenase
MTQYILLIQGNAKSKSTTEDWDQFFTAARQSGSFEGGSAIGKRAVLGDTQSAKSSEHIVGYMRFDSEDKQKLLDLLKRHPVVMHGGSVELREMPKSSRGLTIRRG